MLDTSNGSYDLATPPEDPAVLLAESLRAAADGNAVSAAIVAALLHLQAKGTGATAEGYEPMLQQVFDSQDAELIVCVGEEMLAGTLYELDVDRAHKFFDRADEISGYMGAYAAAVVLYKINPDSAIELLDRAANTGHLTSLAFKRVLECNKMKRYGDFMRLIYAAVITVQMIFVRDRNDLGWRLWRYGDLSNETGGGDRRRPLQGLKLMSQ